MYHLKIYLLLNFHFIFILNANLMIHFIIVIITINYLTNFSLKFMIQLLAYQNLNFMIHFLVNLNFILIFYFMFNLILMFHFFINLILKFNFYSNPNVSFLCHSIIELMIFSLNFKINLNLRIMFDFTTGLNFKFNLK